MKNYGRTHLNTLFKDRVLYRNLVPGDPTLPGLAQLRASLGIPENTIPRKTSLDYARVVQTVIKAAQAGRGGPPLTRVIMLGDTRMNDGTALINIASTAGWQGMAFIGTEKDGPESLLPEQLDHTTIYNANRWSALLSFDSILADHGFAVDAATVVLIDIDKTALAARGRNHTTIDGARLSAARDTAITILGSDADLARLEQDYHRLNQPDFHPLTQDNQDALVYLCMILSSGWTSIDRLLEDGITRFEAVLQSVEKAKLELPGSLQVMHADFQRRYLGGDPTPFKDFRRSEFLATSRRMGSHPDSTPIETLLAEEIVLTAEVFHTAAAWAERGALIFSLSDKPDEATNPTPEQAAQGMKPIHAIETHMIGV